MSDIAFRLVEVDPPLEVPRLACRHCRTWVNVRRYPALNPPAIFADCYRCGLTWDVSGLRTQDSALPPGGGP